MHELGLCTSIVGAIERRAGARPVRRVRVRVGRLNHVHPDAFDQSFTLAAMGTVAEAARADLVLLPVRARCSTCEGNLEGDDMPMLCPVCGGSDMQLTVGDELVLESIEYAG
jgi:hydrogenase nickel incorporation protein HypA/HybF